MKLRIALLIAAIIGLSLFLTERAKVASRILQYRFVGKRTVADRVSQFGPAADRRLKPFFDGVGLSYPPSAISILAIKEQRTVELFAQNADGNWIFIRTYPILAASGTLGPKLMEGDRQVPEGIYGIESLNPNSLFHLSLRLNYPNEFDKRMALQDGRQNLGSDIMIHGSNLSIGCLAMGDVVAEELFVLAARVGIKNVRVILSPVDFREQREIPFVQSDVTWTEVLYRQIADAMQGMKKSGKG